ncbi:MAG: hypothetical protein KDC38_10120, partial [Planctomycetes bacterium]|nr:hypothetical protein [Planctomycetota bacterium]
MSRIISSALGLALVTLFASTSGAQYTITSESYAGSGSISPIACGGPFDSYSVTQTTPFQDSVSYNCPGGPSYLAYSQCVRNATATTLSLSVEQIADATPLDASASTSMTIDFTVPMQSALTVDPILLDTSFSCLEATLSDLTSSSVVDLIAEPLPSALPPFCPPATGTEHCCNEFIDPYTLHGLEAILVPGRTYRVHLSVESLESPCSAEIAIGLEIVATNPGLSVTSQTYSGSGGASFSLLCGQPDRSYSVTRTLPVDTGIADDQTCAFLVDTTSIAESHFAGGELVASVSQVSGGPCCTFTSASASLVIDLQVPVSSELTVM